MEPVSPLPSLLRMMVNSVARHALTYIGGALALNGAIQTDQQSQFVNVGASIVLFAAGLIWSALEKKAAVAVTQPAPAADLPPHQETRE